MTFNVGGAERAIRIVLGMFLLSVGFFHLASGGWRIAAFILGTGALGSGIFKFCPAWTLLGINTRRARPAN